MKIKLQNPLTLEHRGDRKIARAFVQSLTLLAFLVFVSFASAEVQDIIVGITPTCPYGISACWAGAYEALLHLEGVASVDKNPDFNTSTAHIRLKSGGLPNPDKLRAQFESLVGKVYIFRGVEATVEGVLKEENRNLVVQLPESKESLHLVSLETKLQWNFEKQRPRGIEADEGLAYRQLIDKNKEVQASALKMGETHPIVRVTGPLKMTDKGPVLEVREFSLPKTSSAPHPQD